MINAHCDCEECRGLRAALFDSVAYRLTPKQYEELESAFKNMPPGRIVRRPGRFFGEGPVAYGARMEELWGQVLDLMVPRPNTQRRDYDRREGALRQVYAGVSRLECELRGADRATKESWWLFAHKQIDLIAEQAEKGRVVCVFCGQVNKNWARYCGRCERPFSPATPPAP